MKKIYELPDLNYAYSALEPYISKKIMKLHHSKHHASYVENANNALKKIEELKKKNNFENIEHIMKVFNFNVGGHLNHSIFWKNLSPNGGKILDNRILLAITQQFGSFNNFKEVFKRLALSIQGSGWVYLAVDKNKNLTVGQIYDQHNNLPIFINPILLLDMWEHAFYIDYLNIKIDYIKAFWKIVNWENVNQNFLKYI